MNHLINFLRKRNDGYVSIEVVIIGGLIVGFGALTIQGFHNSGSAQVQNTVNTIDEKFSTPDMQRILDR